MIGTATISVRRWNAVSIAGVSSLVGLVASLAFGPAYSARI